MLNIRFNVRRRGRGLLPTPRVQNGSGMVRFFLVILYAFSLAYMAASAIPNLPIH